jgi:hypothetical protein
MSHRREEAVSMLIDAVDHGLAFAIAKTIERTPDFDSLKSIPKYADLIAHIRARSGQVQHPN